MHSLPNRRSRTLTRRARKGLILAWLGMAALALVIAGCAGSTKAYEVRYYPESPTATSGLPTTVYLSIVTPDQTGQEGYPAYIPADLTVPAHSKVTFVITNFDDATPLPTPMFAKVTGTVGGTMSVQPISAGAPNNAGKATVESQVDPNDVSHTFTAPTLGKLNIPVPAHSRVTFTVETGAAGSIPWVCTDPCGSGPDGLQGAMDTPGYMSGTITVA